MAKKPRAYNQNQPQQPNDTHRDEVLNKIIKCNTVINHLKSNPGWEVIIGDLSLAKKRADDTWHLIPKAQSEKLDELRVTKLAADYLINLYSIYEHDLVLAEKELNVIDNKETKVPKDFDND